MRVVPERGRDGAPFDGPGVDVFGDDAARAFALAEPLEAWLRAREPGLVLRSLSAELASGRFLISFDDPHRVSDKPVALRIVTPDSTPLLEAARALVGFLDGAAEQRLARRAPTGLAR